MTLNKKLCIGTAQFGTKYGISNKSGKIKKKELDKLFFILKKKKIKFLDTSLNYRNCEKILNKLDLEKIEVISKIPKIPKRCPNINKWIENKVTSSLKRINKKSFYAILLHNPNDMLTNKANMIYKSLLNLKKNKKIKKIGISIYDFENSIRILKRFNFDILQCPYNVIDRRLDNIRYMNFFKRKKIEIHVRSVFLQGLLLMKKRPSKFDKWAKLFEIWDKMNKHNTLQSALNAVNFVLKNENINKIILGFENSNQLKSILQNYQNKKTNYPKNISSKDLNLINPNNWN